MTADLKRHLFGGDPEIELHGSVLLIYKRNVQKFPMIENLNIVMKGNWKFS